MAKAAELGVLPTWEEYRRPNPVLTALGLLRQKPLGLLGFALLLVVVFCAVFGPGISIGGTEILPGFDRYDPNRADVLNKEKSPTMDHIFGTDSLGRDVYSRIIHGSRPSLQVGIYATLLGTLVGTAIGLFTGYVGGWWDMIIQRLMDGVMAIPPLVLLLSLVSITSPSLRNIVLILVVFIAPSTSRVVRGAVLTTKESQFIEAARAMGSTPLRVALRHVLPNLFAPIMVLATITIGGAILVEASLSFLGLGVPPPTPTWGSMLSRGTGASSIERAPWIALAPGIAITVTVVGFNLVGDALRDILDPRLRKTG
ncbi:MAG: ABC transporter permease [Dehalococcoidia bacterium]|nr:ABC transporter permease [Dehalococcoidia bacterium]